VNNLISTGLKQSLALASILAILGLVPFLGITYLIVFLIWLLVYIIIAESYNIVGGYMGYINLGHGIFFGIGLYAFAISYVKGIPLLLSMAVAAIAAVITAALISYPLFRLKGAYFSLAAFALLWVMEAVITNLEWLTGGPRGLRIPTGYNLIPAYYALFCLAIFIILLNYKILHSRLGLTLIAIRDDEDVAKASGIATFKYKLEALTISALFPGLAGGIYAWYGTYVYPAFAFGIENALGPLVGAWLGGSGTVLGPVLGVFILMIVEEILWTHMAYLHLAVYGVIIILVGLFMPGGLIRSKPLRSLIIKLRLGSILHETP
jgi:branched-chain amino acid transport system permease protein